MYVPLQVLSCYSLLQSTLDLKSYLKKAKELGYQAVCLTDVNVMYAAIDFYTEAKKLGLKPLLGLTLQLGDSLRPTQTNELVFLAKNNQGYHNLLKLSSLKMTQTNENKSNPLDFQQIASFLSDLYVILPTQKNPLTPFLQFQQLTEAKQWLDEFKKLLDPNSLFIGVSANMSAELLTSLKSLSAATNCPLVYASPVHYLQAQDYFDVMVLRAIKEQKVLSKTLLQTNRLGRHYLHTPAEVLTICEQKDLLQAYQNIAKIVENINFEIEFSPIRLPKFNCPAQLTSQAYLAKLCQDGLKLRAQKNNLTDLTVYQERLQSELATIHQMGFDDYFLIVWDLTNFAHEKQIRTGPGRGSAAGSLVAYCLFITDVDPIKYGLLFERFLNKQRKQMPDIDLDLPDRRRNEVIKYVHQKYGHTKMAQIITFGTLAAKQAIRDVARVLGQDIRAQNQWSKALSQATNQVGKFTLASCHQHPAVQRLLQNQPDNQLIFQTAQHLEGLPRHFSTHAAGVVLSDQPLSNVIAVQLSNDGILLTQFAKEQVEKVGLLKMDLLGLRNLTILDDALRFTKFNYQNNFDITQINLDDAKVLKLFQTANTDGIFQFESNGIKNVLRQLQPTSFEDIVAANALFRPGPMDNIGEFIARKHGQKPVVYPSPILEEILAKTYGIIVYQEQVMQVVAQMGGFSLSQADILRRAISAKKAQEIEQLKQKFIKGAMAKNISLATATQVYEYIEKFSNYGFNRSHAVAYSKMAFELAYLKTYYPAAFYTALLNNGSPEVMRRYLTELKQRHLTIHLPSVNYSQANFILKDGAIYYGLKNIKGLPSNFVNEILTQRQQSGLFKDLENFMRRLDKRFLKKEFLEALIYAGAFDGLGQSRAQMLELYPKLLNNIELSGNNVELFKLLAPKQENVVVTLTPSEQLEKEAAYLGSYVSGHPTDTFKKLAQQAHVTPISLIEEGKNVKILFYLKEIKEIRTKKGDLMAFLDGNDSSGQLDVVVFPQEYQRFKELFEPQRVFLLEGKIEKRNKFSLIVKQAKIAIEPTNKAQESLYLRLNPTFEQKDELKKILLNTPGEIPVILFDEATHSKTLLNKSFCVTRKSLQIKELEELLGKENVILK